VKYLLNEIDEWQFKTILQREDKAYRKNLAKSQVFDMVYQASSDIFRNFVNSSEPVKSEVHTTYLQLVELFQYANRSIAHLEKAYGCKIPHYDTRPFNVA
jgi:hypothetical protein